MPSCSAITQKGNPCKLRCLEGQSTCYVHKLIECKICSYNLPIKKFSTSTLSCGHSGICNGCEIKWKSMGKYTCPFCREYVYIDSMETCVTILSSLLDENKFVNSRIQKIEVSDRLFKVLATLEGKMIMLNHVYFRNTVSSKLDELETCLINTPEYYYVDKWRKCISIP